MELTIGSIAPDFKLYDTEKNLVSLSDYKGKNVVLLFFPLAFSGVCTKELCSVRDDFSSYGNLNAEILGISIDSLFTLGKFKQAENLGFKLLSDFNADVITSYGLKFDVFPSFQYKNVAKRAAFVIGPDGKIKHKEIMPTPGEVPSFDAIKECLGVLVAQ